MTVLQKLKEEDLPYLDLAELDTYNNVLTGEGYGIATPQQLRFVNALIFHGSTSVAYDASGHKDISHYDTNTRSRKVNHAYRRPMVQNLYKIAMRDWCTRARITRESLAAKALEAYDNSDNVREQLEALKLVAKLSGFT